MRPLRVTLLDGSTALVNPDAVEFVRPPGGIELSDPLHSVRQAVLHLTSGAEIAVRQSVSEVAGLFAPADPPA